MAISAIRPDIKAGPIFLSFKPAKVVSDKRLSRAEATGDRIIKHKTSTTGVIILFIELLLF
jgi:hypothetical protein